MDKKFSSAGKSIIVMIKGIVKLAFIVFGMHLNRVEGGLYIISTIVQTMPSIYLEYIIIRALIKYYLNKLIRVKGAKELL